MQYSQKAEWRDVHQGKYVIATFAHKQKCDNKLNEGTKRIHARGRIELQDV